MNPANFAGASQFLGKPESMDEEDCNAVPIARGIWNAPSGQILPVVITCWEPTEEERRRITEGGKIYLHLIGRSMQPAMLSTGIEAEIVGSN